jgi:hypothetical protein
VLAKIVFLVNVKVGENIKVHLIQIERSDIKVFSLGFLLTEHTIFASTVSSG